MFSDPLTLFLIAACSATAVAISFFARRWLSGQPLVAYTPRRNIPWHGGGVILAILGWMFIRAIGAEVYVQFDPPTAAQSTEIQTETSEEQPVGEEEVSSAVPEITSLQILFDAVFSLLAVVAICMMMKLAVNATWEDLGFCFDFTWSDVRLGMLAGMALIPPLLLLQMALVQLIPSEHQIVKLFEQQPSGTTMAIMFFSAVIVAPLSEEFFIRVILQGWLEKRSSEHQTAWQRLTNPPEPPIQMPEPSNTDEAQLAHTADPGIATSDEQACSNADSELAEPLHGWYATLPILFSSSCFAVMHFGYGPDPIPIFLLALALGFLYQRTHRLIASITLHALLNGTSLFLLWASLDAG